MKRNSIYMWIIFSFCLLFFNGCGLDYYYVLDAPDTSRNTSSIDSANYTTHTSYDSSYFDFYTYDDQDENVLDMYKGTAVYYKIYNSYSTMNSRISTLSSLGSSTNVQAAATQMIDTYTYCELGLCAIIDGTVKSLSLSPLVEKISKSTKNREVYIRISNYQDSISDDYRACVKIEEDSVLKYMMYNGSDIDYFEKISDAPDGYSLVIPMRKGNELNFDFGRKYEYGSNAGSKVLPESGDSDFQCDTASEDGMYYVDLYAVAVGYKDFTAYYSNVLHLGSVGIDSDEEDN